MVDEQPKDYVEIRRQGSAVTKRETRQTYSTIYRQACPWMR